MRENSNIEAFRGILKVFRKSTGGFTLVELIVVITILAILATVGFLSLSGYSDDARTATVKANVRTVYSAILTESTTSGNSPRYYVDHGTGAALSWAFVFVDGKQVALTGGNVGETPTDSNYTAGNPRWDRLRMNGEKFRLSRNGKRPVPPPMGRIADGKGTFPVPPGAVPEEAFAEPPEAGNSPSAGGLPYAFGGYGMLGDEALAAYSSGELAVGAVDVFKVGANGRKRATPYFQVAGVVPGSKVAVVSGNLAAGTAGGLIKDPAATDPAYSLADGIPSGSPVSKTCKAAKVSNPSAGDGMYRIDPDEAGPNPPFTAYCDMTTDGGGWTRVGYSADLPFQQQFSGGDAWRYLPSNFSLEFSDAQINTIRNASSEAKQTYVHTCNGVIGYYYTDWANYDYSAGFRFHDGTASLMGTGSYSPLSVSVSQDNCKGNGSEGGTMANATIFNITGKYLPVVNVQTRDNGDGGEKFGSPLTSYPAYFR